MGRITSQTFDTNGTWTCPAGVTTVILFGRGASGAGGNGNDNTYGSGGGEGRITVPIFINVVPNTTYSITIGAGGNSHGGATMFGGLYSFIGGLRGCDAGILPENGYLSVLQGGGNDNLSGYSFSLNIMPMRSSFERLSPLTTNLYNNGGGGDGGYNGQQSSGGNGRLKNGTVRQNGKNGRLTVMWVE